MRLLWLILAAASAWAPQAAPEHAEIAFVSDGRILSSRADGSERRLLLAPSRPREALSQPAWSPDGSKLAYVSDADDGDAARLMLLDGTGAVTVTPRQKGIWDFSPAWSPDGTALAFSRFVEMENGYRAQILARDLATGAERPLVSVRVGARLNFVSEPSWSPDGATIAYTQSMLDRSYDIRGTIRTVAAAGGASRLLIRDAHSPAWAPDGRRLAFASIRDRNGSAAVPTSAGTPPSSTPPPPTEAPSPV